MKILRRSWIDLLIITIVLIPIILIQSYGIGKIVNVFTDEGVYLYTAKLITQGYLPYRDFFLIHLPLLIYLNAFILGLVRFNLNLYHFIYICWVFSTIIPLYLIVKKLTRERLGPLLAIIFYATFSEMVQWDSHFFAFRQASLPFLAWTFFFIFIKHKQKNAAIFLSFFAASLLTNLLIAFSFIGILVFSDYIFQTKNLFKSVKKYADLIFIFSCITSSYYLLTFLIPHSFNNIIIYQIDPRQPKIELIQRFRYFINMLSLNWPILIFGLLGSLIFKKKVAVFSLFNLASMAIVVFFGKNFYPHYFSILGLGLALSSGILFGSFIKSPWLKIFTFILAIGFLYQTSFKNLKFNLITNKNPLFFRAVNFLKNTPEPLYTLEPIYALYANKILPFHYFAADMRIRRVLGKNLTEHEYKEILGRTNTVLIEPFAKNFMPKNIYKLITTSFNLVYDDGVQQILIKKP